jgi:hypothetical protein
MSRPVTLPLCLLLVFCGIHCGSQDVSPNAAANAAANASTNKAPTSPASAPAEQAPAKPMTTLVTPTSKPSEPSGAVEVNSAGPVPGPIDPAWLRSDLFPGATVSSAGRTARDSAGLFSTQLLLALPEGTTREKCIETVTAAVAGAVPALERKEAADGRVTLTGSNDDYTAILVCGEAKGKMSAYLSYRWLRAPKSP